MNTFNQLEIVWKSHREARLPEASTIIKQAKRDNTGIAYRILIQVLLLALAIVSIGFVLFRIHFNYLSSYFGIGLMFACIVSFGALRLRQGLFLLRLDMTAEPKLLLKKLLAFHEKQKWLNTKGVFIYVCLLNLAFALYFYEIIFKAPITNAWKFSIIAGYIAWILFTAVFLEKRAVNREHKKTLAVIQQLQHLTEAIESVQ